MKKTNFLWMIAAFFVFTGCNKYDDEIDQLNQDITLVDSEVQQLAQQLLALQNWQTQVNTDIQSLKTIVAALEKKDYVTSVEPTADGTGYVITFQNSGTVAIHHGKDGETPDISVKQAEDGHYYWTVDGDWLTDADGKKIPTTGEDGKDGADAIAPQVRISSTTNLWEISTDGGGTWTSTGVQATGPKGDKGNTGATGAQGPQGEKGDKGDKGDTGAQGPQGEKGDKGDKGDTGASGSDGDDGSHGDSFFSSVVVNDDKVVFTLSDGTTFALPRHEMFANRIQSLTYIPTHTDGKATMTYNNTSGKWEAELSFFVTPKSVVGNIKQEHISAKGVYTAATRAVNLIDLSVTAFESDATNGTITVTVSGDNLTNFLNGMSDAAVFLIISDGNSEFASDYVPLALKNPGDINAANMSADDLKAVVTQALNVGKTAISVAGNLSEEQQRAVAQAISDWHGNDASKNGTIDLTYTETTRLCDGMMDTNNRGNSEDNYAALAIKTISMPKTISAGQDALSYCRYVQSIDCPELEEVGDYCFDSVGSRYGQAKVTLPKLKNVGSFAFQLLGAESLELPELENVPKYCFQYSKLKVIRLPKVEGLGDGVFWGMTSLETLNFESVITPWGERLFNETPTENVTLYLHKDQHRFLEHDNFDQKRCFGYTFKEIKKYGE